MALDPKEAALALHRFGFSPRAGSISAIASDPRGALLAELDQSNAGPFATAGLPRRAAAHRAVFEASAERAANNSKDSPGAHCLPRARRTTSGKSAVVRLPPKSRCRMPARRP